MKLSATFLACVLGAVTSATANANPWVKMMTKESSQNQYGAVYLITNDPADNLIIAGSIGSDGTVTLDRAVATGGRGLHGVAATGNTAPDALFSQGSVQVSAKANLLAAVNPGSNTVSLFSIDPKQPTNITPVGYPVSSEGEFPQSVAFNSDGSRLCVVNTGAVSAVACFSVDKKLGLVSIPNTVRYLGLNQTTPPSGPPNTYSQVIFSEDDSQLIATFKGNAAGPGYLNVWDIQADGSLSANSSHVPAGPSGVTAFSITPIPGQDAYLVTDPGLGFDIVDTSGKNRSSTVPVAGEMATCWSAHSTATGSYFTVDAGANTVREVSLNAKLTAKVIANYTLPSTTAPLDGDAATINGKGYLYVLGSNATAVEVFSLANGPGKAKHISTVNIAGPAKAAGIPIQAYNLQGMVAYVKSS